MYGVGFRKEVGGERRLGRTRLQDGGSQGWQREYGGVRLVVTRHGLCFDLPPIFYSAASIANGVGADRFAVRARLRQAHSITVSHDGGHIEREYDHSLSIECATEERNYAVVGIRDVNPFEPFPAEV